MARHLPAIHHDLFDWLLVAQALFEPLHLLISDGHLPKYADLVILL
ncbi:twitching motility protein PilT [Mycetohabitans sp. B5]|nr:twitching motility protein PilT [Mycetohabitans sp. B5]